MPRPLKGFPDFLQCIFLEECTSTNDFIKENLDALRGRIPLLVVARAQSAGRGRQQRQWHSPQDRGVYATLALALDAKIQIQFLSLLSGIAVAETLEEVSGRPFSLKWPNDVLHGGKKIAGILIENIICGERGTSLVGIGIDVGQRPEEFPPDLQDRAISLSMITGAPQRPSDLLPPLMRRFFAWRDLLERGEGGKVASRYRELLHAKIGQAIVLSRPGEVVSGTFAGIGEDGGLILLGADGKERLFYEGELLS